MLSGGFTDTSRATQSHLKTTQNYLEMSGYSRLEPHRSARRCLEAVRSRLMSQNCLASSRDRVRLSRSDMLQQILLLYNI